MVLRPQSGGKYSRPCGVDVTYHLGACRQISTALAVPSAAPLNRTVEKTSARSCQFPQDLAPLNKEGMSPIQATAPALEKLETVTHRLLVVDDDVVLSKSIAGYLIEAGFAAAFEVSDPTRR